MVNKWYKVNMREIYHSVHNGYPENYFNQQYHLLTKDHDEVAYDAWLEYLVDRYCMFRDYGNLPNECTSLAISSCLNDLL